MNAMLQKRCKGEEAYFVYPWCKDTFVPCSMCDELYASCASQKTKLIVKGAGHCESYYKNTKLSRKHLINFWKEL